MAQFRDKDGYTIEVTHVTFFPAGGGLESKMSFETFSENFEPVTGPAPYRLVDVTADWLDGSIPAYSDGRRWNGWAVPHFPLSSLPTLAALMPAVLEWNEAEGMLYCVDAELNEQGPQMVWDEIYVEGQPMKVVWFDGWCWELAGDRDVD